MANRVEPAKRSFAVYSAEQQDLTEQVAKAPRLGSPGRAETREETLASVAQDLTKGAITAPMQPEIELEGWGSLVGLNADGDVFPDGEWIDVVFNTDLANCTPPLITGQSSSSRMSSSVTAVPVTSQMNASPDILGGLPAELLLDILARLPWRDQRQLMALSTGLRATVVAMERQIDLSRKDGRLTSRQLAQMEGSRRAFNNTYFAPILPEQKRPRAKSTAENQFHLYWGTACLPTDTPTFYQMALGIGDATNWKSLTVQMDCNGDNRLSQLLNALAAPSNSISSGETNEYPEDLFQKRMVGLHLTSSGSICVPQELINRLRVNLIYIDTFAWCCPNLDSLVFNNPSLKHLSIKVGGLSGDFDRLMVRFAPQWKRPDPMISMKLLDLPKNADWDLLHRLVQDSQLVYLCLHSEGALKNLSLAQLFPPSMRELAMSGTRLRPENLTDLQDALDQRPGVVLRFYRCDFRQVEPQLLAIIAKSRLAGLSMVECTQSGPIPYIEAIESNRSLKTVELDWKVLVPAGSDTDDVEAYSPPDLEIAARMTELTRNRSDLFVADYPDSRGDVDATEFFDHCMPGLE